MSEVPLLPNINDRINNTTNRKNKNLATPAALAAIPPKPNIAAMIATTKNINVQRNIGKFLKVNNADINKISCHNLTSTLSIPNAFGREGAKDYINRNKFLQ
jgi:hypothetical protein